MNETINVTDTLIIPVTEILGCTKSELSQYSPAYILYKVREYYANLA